MDEMDHNGSSTKEGNTRSKIGKYWAFTFNNFDKHGYPDPGSFGSLLSKYGYYHFGVEKGELGTPHLQGFCQFRQRLRPRETIKVPQVSWSFCNGSEKQNMKYTGKSGVIYTNMDIIKDPMEGKEYYPWQAEIVEIIKKGGDDRKVHWYWEEQGMSGKSDFTTHLCLHNDRIIAVDGAKNNILYAICQMKRKPEVVIWDIERTPETQDKVSYSAIESIKNGRIFSTKYESGMVLFNKPVIIIFANFHPDENKLSSDRWNINYINNNV